jgi:hypothetical protein
MGCTLSPTSVSLDSTTTTATATLSITTTAPNVKGASFAGLEGGFGMIVGVALVGFSTRFRHRVPLILLCLLPALAMVSTGCGGNGGDGTPNGSYSVTVNAANGSETHSAAVSVSVQ